MNKRILASLALAGLTTAAYAQQSYSGRVVDAQGKGVEGASVTIRGTRSGVAADQNGNFTINAKQGDVLVINAINFGRREVTLGSGTTVTVSLERADANQIDEVVVTAQGIRRKPREIGYAYAKVSNEEVRVGQSPQLANALSGKVAGLAVYNVNNSVDPQVKVVLRGYRSLTGNNEALLVIDGFPTSQTQLALINPNDIESVTVLKSGQAAALYGSDGVNGALIITTKKGRAGKMQVSFNHATNFEEISFLPKFQEKYGSGSHYATAYGAAGYKTNYLDRLKDNWRPFENQQFGDAYDGSQRISGRQTEDGSQYILPYSPVKNGRRNSFSRGSNVNNQVNVQGGGEAGTYYMSVENNKTTGIVPNDASDRTSVRLAASRTDGKLSTNFSASYVQARYMRTTSDFYYDVLNTAAHIPVGDLRDWQTNKFANPNGYYNDYYNNPYFNADINRQNYTDNNLQGTIEFNYKLKPWLSLYDRVGAMSNTRARKNYTSKFIYTDYAKTKAFVPAPWAYANDYDGISRAGTDILGSVYDATTVENITNNEAQIRTDNNFGDVGLKGLVGFSLYQRRTKFQSVGSSSIVIPEVYNVANRLGDVTGSESSTVFRKVGYYVDVTADYKGWLVLNASFRTDASSKFYNVGRDANLYNYQTYGASLSFIATDAFPQFKGDILNFAKLRLGYNKNANDNLDPHRLELLYPNGTGFPFGSTAGTTVGNVLPDAGLKPESVRSFEAGGEFQMFKSRLTIDVTGYFQDSRDQILTVRIPSSTGYSNLLANVANSHNWGYEAEVRYQIIKNRNFNWELSGRYSYNDNLVKSLYQDVKQFAYGGYSYASTYVMKDKRYPFLQAVGYNRDPQSGMIIVNKANGYPTFNTANLQEFGGTLPRHIAGLSSRMNYRSFSFNFSWEYRGGNSMFSQLGRDMTFTGSGKWTDQREPFIFPNSVVDDGSGKYIPNNVLTQEAEYSLWVDQYRLVSENFVTPGWFIKLRDVNLTYTVNANVIRKTKIFSGATVGLFGRNLLTIVDKSNMYTDPEFSYTTGNGLGINNSLQTPPTRQYGFNVSLTF